VSNADLERELASVRVLFCDVEGCLTDGTKWYSEKEDIFIPFNSRDGLGLWLLEQFGVRVFFVTASIEKSIARKAHDMEISGCLYCKNSKMDEILKLCKRNQWNLNECCAVGDDWWDIEMLQECGLGVCPSDAAPAAIEVADLVTNSEGGKGAVRELADKILSAKGIETVSVLQALRNEHVVDNSLLT